MGLFVHVNWFSLFEKHKKIPFMSEEKQHQIFQIYSSQSEENIFLSNGSRIRLTETFVKMLFKVCAVYLLGASRIIISVGYSHARLTISIIPRSANALFSALTMSNGILTIGRAHLTHSCPEHASNRTLMQISGKIS